MSAAAAIKKGPPGEVGHKSVRDKILSGKRRYQCRAPRGKLGFMDAYMPYGIYRGSRRWLGFVVCGAGGAGDDGLDDSGLLWVLKLQRDGE